MLSVLLYVLVYRISEVACNMCKVGSPLSPIVFLEELHRRGWPVSKFISCIQLNLLITLERQQVLRILYSLEICIHYGLIIYVSIDNTKCCVKICLTRLLGSTPIQTE